MNWKRKSVTLLAALWLTLPLSAAAQPDADSQDEAGIASVEAVAAGLGINVPLVGRLTGAGDTLYISTLDVTNNSTSDAQVDFYLDGSDLTTGTSISRVGSISSNGSLGAQGSGGLMRHRSNAHFDDFIDALGQAGILPSSIGTDGFIGSVLFVFNGFTKPAQASVTVRFYNSFGGGTIGQALKGHVIATGEPQTAIAAFRDSRAQTAGPRLYANMFINNTGLTPAGAGTSGSVTVHSRPTPIPPGSRSARAWI